MLHTNVRAIDKKFLGYQHRNACVYALAHFDKRALNDDPVFVIDGKIRIRCRARTGRVTVLRGAIRKQPPSKD